MREDTKAVIAGRDPRRQYGAVNPPIVGASTIIFPDLEGLRASRRIHPGDGLTYGVHGTPTTFALEEAVKALEGGFRTRLQPSGLMAISAALLAFLSSGDHLLMTDSAYGPTRALCDGLLKRMGVETTYYDPLIGGGIRDLIRPNTKVVFVEAPGSWTFEMQDIPAIATEARRRGALVLMDNTWASPLYFKPFEHGVNVSIQALTKYPSGASDLVMGSVTCDEESYPAFRAAQAHLGVAVTGDDAARVMRGIRSMPTRLARHWTSGLDMANWLAARPEVAEVIHPALPGDAGYAIWKRDFKGASSLFAFTLKPEYSSEERLAALLDHSHHFGMGFSWGGYESLLIPIEPRAIRTATVWPRPGRPEGQLMRIHVGLENVADLQDDLAEGFKRMRKL